MSWSVFRPWQPRYFVLRNNELSWHSGPDTVSERGTGKTIPWDIGKCVLTNRPDVENCFMVHRTTDGRTLLVKAATPEEKHRWMEALKPLHNGSSTFDVITRHVCDAVLEAATEEIQSHPRQEHFQGAMLFADISGFTALSERLRAESGQQGCERLNAIINQFFDQIIGKCLAHGGDVVKFAGDAMFVVFRALDTSDQQGIELTAAAIRAAACAVDVMALDGQQVEAGGTTTPLRLHCGIGAGQMAGMTVGSKAGADGRFEYVVGGDPLPQITLTDKVAVAGQVIVAPEAWGFICAGGPSHGLTVEPADHGCKLLVGCEQARLSAPARRSAHDTGVDESRMSSRDRLSSSSTAERSSIRTASRRSVFSPDPALGRARLLKELREQQPEKVERVLNELVHRYIPASVQQMIEVESTMDPSKRMHTHWAATQRTITIIFVRIWGWDADDAGDAVDAGSSTAPGLRCCQGSPSPRRRTGSVPQPEPEPEPEPGSQSQPRLSPLGRLHEAVCIMQKALFQFEGAVSRLQIDDKGTVLKGAFGLPPFFHNNDPARAVLAALQIEDGLKSKGVGCTIGIATGDIFCGMVGNADRCEYTSVGAEVNLAARFMIAERLEGAYDGILCDETTRKRAESAEGQAAFDGPHDVTAKGKKIPAYRVRRVNADGFHGRSWKSEAGTSPLIGRERELHSILSELEQVMEPAGPPAPEGLHRGGRLVVVEGATGIGKTRLLQALAEHPEGRLALHLQATAHWWSKDTPLHAFYPIFQKILEEISAATFGETKSLTSSNESKGAATPTVRLPRTLSTSSRTVAQAIRAVQGQVVEPQDDADEQEDDERHRRHMGQAVQELLASERKRQRRHAQRRSLAESLVTSSLSSERTHSVGFRKTKVGASAGRVAPYGAVATASTPRVYSRATRGFDGTNPNALLRTRSVSLASPRYRLPGGATPRRAAAELLTDGSAEQHLDVLNEFLPVHFEESQSTAALKPADKLNIAIYHMSNIFRAYAAHAEPAAATKPVLLIIENGQDMDSASLRLTAALLDTIPQLLVVLATRHWRQQRPSVAPGTTTETRPSAGQGRKDRSASVSVLVRNRTSDVSLSSFRSTSLAEWLLSRASAAAVVRLDALSQSDIGQLAKGVLGVKRIPAQLEATAMHKSHGNPYFAEQLLQTWIESGELVVADGRVTFKPAEGALTAGSSSEDSALPVAVQQVIMERVERLTWSQQITLRAASAVGGVFNIEILKRIHNRLHELGNDDIRLDLTQLCEQDLLEEVTGRDGESSVPGRRRGRSIGGRHSITQPMKTATTVRYEDNDRFEGTLYDGCWDFKSATVRQTIYEALSMGQLQAAHREVARYREESLMKTVERRCRRHSSIFRTASNSPSSVRAVAEARDALEVMASRPLFNSLVHNAKVTAVDDEGEQRHCLRIEFRRTGVSALLDHWERQAVMLAAESAEDQREWLESLVHAAGLEATEGDVKHAERLKQGWLNKAVGKHGKGNWTREWLVLLPGRLPTGKPR